MELLQWQALLAVAPSIGGLLAIAAALDSWRNRGDDTTLKRIASLKESVTELDEGYKRLEVLREAEIELLRQRVTELEKKAQERDSWEKRALAAEKLAQELTERVAHLEIEVERLTKEKQERENGTAKL